MSSKGRRHFIKYKDTSKGGLFKDYKKSLLYKYNCLDLCFIILFLTSLLFYRSESFDQNQNIKLSQALFALQV